MAWRKQKTHYQATRFHAEGPRMPPPRRFRWEWLVLVVLLVACAVSAYLVFNSKRFVVKQVRLHQQGHAIQVGQLTDIISKQTKGTFFSFSCDRLRRRLLLLPWVESVSVRRHWPDAVVIWLKERHASAVWNESALLDEDGVLFYPALETFPVDLPRLSAKHQDASAVLSLYRDLSALLLPLRLHIVSLEEPSSNTWQMTVSPDVVLMLPKKGTIRAMKRWLAIYPTVMKGHLSEVKRVDLRYAHGLAVQWRSKTGAHRASAKNKQK